MRIACEVPSSHMRVTKAQNQPAHSCRVIWAFFARLQRIGGLIRALVARLQYKCILWNTSTNRECPDQTARMRSLIWAFGVRKWYKDLFHAMLTRYLSADLTLNMLSSNSNLYEPFHEKRMSRAHANSKALTQNLRMCTAWSGPLLSA